MIIFLGLVLGLISAFLGVGGGVFLVPLLPKVYNLSAYEAILLSLTFIFFSVSINTIVYHIANKVVWDLVLRMGFFIVIGGFIGSRLASFVPELMLRSLLALLLLLMSRSFLLSYLNQKNKNTGFFNSVSKLLNDQIRDPSYGLFAGLLSGFVGVGTGVMLNLIVLKNPKVSEYKQAPTVNAMMIFVCFGAVSSSLFFNSDFYEKLLSKIGYANILLMIVGILLGSLIGKRLNDLNLHKTRILILTLITFSLSISVFYEIMLMLK